MNPAGATADGSKDDAQAPTAVARNALYPNNQGMIIAEDDSEADEYDLLREQMLVNYGYNTARAYWGDLEDWRAWCDAQEPPIHPFDAETKHVQAYLDETSNAVYSPNTAARRLTALRLLYMAAVENKNIDFTPTNGVAPVSRRK